MNAKARYVSARLDTSDPALRELSQEELVLRHADLVKRIAYHLVSRMPPNVEVDDLIQAGMLGLLDAARHYRANKGANFETYAGIRIRGAMLDEVRKSDWTPRSVHRTAREVSEVVRRIENETGQDARPADVAAALNLSLEDYHQAMQDAVTCRVFSFEQMSNTEDESPADYTPHEGPGPVEHLEDEDFRRALGAAIESLPQREKLVLSLYYDEEFNLREIGEVLDVSESRVCQIHAQALVRVRSRVEQHLRGA